MRKVLLRSFLSVIILMIMFPGNRPSAAGQIAGAPEAAFESALEIYNANTGRSFKIGEMRQLEGLAYAIAGPEPGAAEEGFTVLLAEDQGASGWLVRTQGLDAPVDYNNLLDRLPEELLDTPLKAMFRMPEASSTETGIPQAEALLLSGNFTGHRLPWPYKTTAYVTQKDSYAGHMNQIDFDIGGLAVPNGDVYATRPGRVVFVKDSSNTNCQVATTECMRMPNVIVVEHAPGELSWYVHLAYRSAAVVVGQQVGYGTKLAREGDTGYSFGVHLHYMASTGHTTWTNPEDPSAAPWATGITAVDFDEYTWAALIPTYSYVYTSQNGANLPPVCPAAGGGLLFREANFSCAGLLENSGYIFRNEASFQNLQGFNDLASSARVPAGWSILLYENADRGGGKKCLNESDNSFAGDTFDNGVPLDNSVSSFEVLNSPDCPVHAPADMTAPSGSLTSPANGTTVEANILLASNASDAGSGVQMVQFTARWDGKEQVIFTDRSAPFSYNWDLCAAGVPDGGLELGQVITDQAWNSTTTPLITVTKAYDCTAIPGGSWAVDYWANPGMSGQPALHKEQTSPFLFEDWGNSSPDGALPQDGWSARFTRSYNFQGGNYRFHCQRSGGCRVLVDGQPLIEAWQEAEFAGSDWSGTLPAGSHTVTVEFFDGSGDARLEAWWRGAGFLPAEQACLADQWCAEMWGNADLTGIPAVKINTGETLRSDWGSNGPHPLLPVDEFSSRYTRQASFDCASYQFLLTTDGPARLWVDGAPIIEAWNEPAPTASYSAVLPLSRGTHSVMAEQADLTGAAGLEVGWEKLSVCPVSAAILNSSTHIARPGARFEPRLLASVTEGYLDPARGDGLYLASGNSLGAANTPVRQIVEAGQNYLFDISNGLSMTAPAANGTYTSQWQIQAGGSPASANAIIQVLVDGTAPQASISAPIGIMNSATVTVRANATDAQSGISHVQFLAWARSGNTWNWYNLGWDSNSADGWSKDWDTSSFSDQSGIVFLAAAWDKAGNYAEARSAGMMLDRTSPEVSISGPATTLDTTRFQVQWNGSDSLSGLHHFDVRVQTDGGAPQNWLVNVPSATRMAWFTGEMGHSYAFQARAVDAAGNASPYTTPTTPAFIRVCTPDSSEPDNTPGEAQTIVPDIENTPRNQCGVGDIDWYVFQAEEGQPYLLSTLELGQTTDTVLTLYDEDGSTKLAEHDNISASNKGSVIYWVADAEGLFYFSVRQADPLLAGNAVTYTPRVNLATPFYMPLIWR